jgi:hypothetical protein
MNSRRSAIAVLACVLGTAAFASSEAWARDPVKEMPAEQPAVVVPRDPSPPNYPEFDSRNQVSPAESSGAVAAPSDQTGLEVVQAGASALGGAGVACGVMWLYRRRNRLAN